MEHYVINFMRSVWPVVVIVGTIAGAAWTAAWNVGNLLRTEIAASESRLAARIAETETRLTARIAETDERLTAQIAYLEARLTTQIAELRQQFVDHLEDHANAR